MPVDAERFAFKRVGKDKAVRLAFDNKTNKVVEVCSYKKENNTFVKEHCRRIPRK